MTDAISRLAAVGVWGVTPESYRTQFIPSCIGNLLPSGTEALAQARDRGEFWHIARADLARGIAWGKHPPGSITTDEGAWGRMLQAIALQAIHGMRVDHGAMATCLDSLKYHECGVYIPSCIIDGEDQEIVVRFGGWAQWPGGTVRSELMALHHTLTTARCYDDDGWLEIVIGLNFAIVACQQHKWDDLAGIAIRLRDNALREAMADADACGGLGLFHEPRTRILLPGRAHEPAAVSPQATAGLAYALLVSHAVTPSVVWKMAAEFWARIVVGRDTHMGQYPAFVHNRRPLGLDIQGNAVHASKAIWPVPGKPATYATGIPASESTATLMDRVAAAMKGLA